MKDLEHCENGFRKITLALEIPVKNSNCPGWVDQGLENTVLGW